MGPDTRDANSARLRNLARHLDHLVSPAPILGERRAPSPRRRPEPGQPDLDWGPDSPPYACDEVYWGGYLDLPAAISPFHYPLLARRPPDVNPRQEDWVWQELPLHVGWCLRFWYTLQRFWARYAASRDPGDATRRDCLRGLMQLSRHPVYPYPICQFFFRAPGLTPSLLEELAQHAAVAVCRRVGLSQQYLPTFPVVQMYRAQDGPRSRTQSQSQSQSQAPAPAPAPEQEDRYEQLPAPWIESTLLAPPAWDPAWAASNVYPWYHYTQSCLRREALRLRDQEEGPTRRLPRPLPLRRRCREREEEARLAAAVAAWDQQEDSDADPEPEDPEPRPPEEPQPEEALSPPAP